MQIVGGGKVREFGAVDELPHGVPDHPLWQESVVLHWYDLKMGIGGMHRIGHEFHNKTNFPNGQVPSWLTIYTADGGVYKQTQIFPLTDHDRLNDGFGADNGNYTFSFDGRSRWSYTDDNVAANLIVEDYHPGIDLWPRDIGTLSDDFAKNHLEAAGRVTGSVKIRGKEYFVDGFGYRDHSWGVREWNTFYSHRWITGVLASNRSFGVTSWHGTDGTMRKAGYLVEGDQVIYVDDVDILVRMEIDGCTHRGGTVVMDLPDGRTITLECQPLGMGAISFYRDIACMDTMCDVTVSDSRAKGYCLFEITTNPQFGKLPPSNLVRAYIDNGFSGF